MADNNILKKVLKGLGDIVSETGKETVKEVGKITESVITGKELLGNLTNLSEQELAQKRMEEERTKQEEMAKLKAQMAEHGRNVQGEMTQIERQDKQQEDQREREMLEQVRAQRMAEQQERAQMSAEMGISTNPAKQKKKRGSAMAQGKKKTQQPDPSQMSQTGEVAGKME